MSQQITISSKKKNKRTRRRMAVDSDNSELLPFANLQRLPMTQTSQLQTNNQYLRCRMDPFSATRGSGHPDGGNKDYIVVDAKTFDTITCVTTAGFMIQTLPTLPFSSIVTGLSAGEGTIDIEVNGVSYGNITNGTGGALGSNIGCWYPMSYQVPYAALNGGQGVYPGTTTPDPYSSSKARLVSIGHRLIYTGTMLNASGTITVNPNNVSFYPSGITTTTGGVGAAVWWNAAGTENAAPTGTPILTCDIAVNSSAFVKDSIMVRPENGVTIIPHHNGTAFQSKPTADRPYICISTTGLNDQTYALASIATSQGPFTAPNPGIIWFDDDWSSYQITVMGMQAGSTFRWETVYCMEYNVSTLSAFAPLTKASSDNNPRVMDVARNLSKLPAATSGGSFGAKPVDYGSNRQGDLINFYA